MCCGTKRLVEIQCTPDCVYLASAREHPAAAVVRRQEHDVARVLEIVRDLNERQQQLFALIASFLVGYRAPELQPLVDADIAGAAAALASTYETSVRGVIYEHRAASPPAERLASALRPVLTEAGQRGGTVFERDAAVVLRRIEDAARSTGADVPDDRRALVDLLGRVIRKPDDARGDAETKPEAASRLILP